MEMLKMIYKQEEKVKTAKGSEFLIGNNSREPFSREIARKLNIDEGDIVNQEIKHLRCWICNEQAVIRIKSSLSGSFLFLCIKHFEIREKYWGKEND